MPERISERDSYALYFVKAFAILASVAAHTSLIKDTTAFTAVVTRIWDMVSTISVGNFFIVGGILYTRRKGDSASFWKRKGLYVVLPWLFCATLTCTYRAVMGHPSDLLGYIRYVLGIGTWYYYVTMYLFLMVFFKLIHNHVPALWGCIAVTVVSLTLRAKYIEIPLDKLVQSEYLNPMYWVGFFALGILLRRNGLRLNRWLVAACFVIFPVAAVVVYRNWIYTYFNIINFIYSTSAFVVLLTLGRWIAGTPGKRAAKWIGSATYCVYMLHMPLAQIFLRRIPDCDLKELLGPVLGLAFMMLLIEAGKWVSRKLPFGDKLRLLVGLR